MRIASGSAGARCDWWSYCFHICDTYDSAVYICGPSDERIHHISFFESDGSSECALRWRNSGADFMKRTIRLPAIVLTLGLFQGSSLAQTSELTPVVSKAVSRTIDLPGEIQPYLNVTLHSRVTGFVEKVLVDRGSIVNEGDVLVELSAPAMT